jgi:hypothetical protein
MEKLNSEKAHARLLFGSHETSPITWIGKPAPATQCYEIFHSASTNLPFRLDAAPLGVSVQSCHHRICAAPVYTKHLFTLQRF